MAAYDSNVPSYPNMFSSDQLSNSYSDYNASHFNPYNYSGVPVNAGTGQPITSYIPPPTPPPVQQTTLNSNAGMEPMGSQARAMQNAGYGDWAMLDPMMAQTSIPGQRGGTGSVAATTGWNGAGTINGPAQSMGTQQQVTQQPGMMAPNAGLNYLQTLAHPDKVVTPGMSVQPTSAQPDGNSIMQILAQLRAQAAPQQGAPGIGGGSSGISLGSNNGFLNALSSIYAGNGAGAASGAK